MPRCPGRRWSHGLLIGVDGSDGATAALRWGVEYAGRHELPVTVQAAWTYRDQHHLDAGMRFDLDDGSDDTERDLMAFVERALGPGTHDLRLRTVCESGVDSLVEASTDADTVVVGARGAGGFKGLLMGSVSRELLHRSHCPVAVVREAAAATDGPIVVGVDGSPTSRRALAWAHDEARSRRCQLVALHAWHIGYAGAVHPSGHLGRDAVRERAAALLDRELAEADITDLAAPVVRALEAGPAAGVLVYASGTASLMVLGSRGHRTLTGLLLGSVADQVTRHAPSPVVVVPPSADIESRAESHVGRRDGS